MRREHVTWALGFVLLMAISHGVLVGHNVRGAAHSLSTGLNAGYPRLANYNGLTDARQVPFYTSYNVVIARRGAPVAALRAANPHATVLLYERSLQADLCCMDSLYGITATAIPPQWWLLGAGSRLPLAIGPDQDWIPVRDPRPFARCQDIQVDTESMHIWNIEGQWLHVQRGYFSQAAPHQSGARIAPHVSYRTDLSNCTLSGSYATLRPWSLNLSAYCPAVNGQTWADFLAKRIASLVVSQGWSGVFFDNLTDLPFSAQVDVNNDGVADGGIVKNSNAWRDGERRLLAAVRKLLPGRPVLVNGDLRIDGVADGREIEGFPTIPGLQLEGAIESYLADKALGTPMTIINPDTQDNQRSWQTTADLAVGVALLGDGFAAYDRGWMNHGDPWWFDSYDNGAGARLRYPVGPWTAHLVLTHPWRFTVGDLIQVENELMLVTGVTPHTIAVERGVQGSSVAAHASGVTVTTPWQRVNGHGYLGLPLGPAQRQATDSWTRYPLPMQLQLSGQNSALLLPLTTHVSDGPTALSSLAQGGTVRALSSDAAALVLQSPLRYDAQAAALTLWPSQQGPVLRTLSFEVSGPAGAQMTVSAGSNTTAIRLQGRWQQVMLPITNVTHIALGMAHSDGQIAVRRLHLYGQQNFLWKRDFTHGIVLVNSTDRLQYLKLRHPYLLSGDQGRIGQRNVTCDIWLPRYQALILLRDSNPQDRCISVPVIHALKKRPHRRA